MQLNNYEYTCDFQYYITEINKEQNNDFNVI